MLRRTKWKSSALAACFAVLGLVPGLARASEAPHTIDVLVVYPGPAQDHLQQIIQWASFGTRDDWGETEMGPFLDASFARVSQIYQQSGVDVEFNVVHHQEIDLSYISAGWKTTLSLALMNSELNNATYTPYIEAIEAIRDAHAADTVVYWRDFQDGGPTSNGAGSIGGGEDEAYVHLTYGGIDPKTIAHELGHLLGGQHSDGVQGTAVYSLDGDVAALREYRTVMTVAYPIPGLDRLNMWRFSSDGTSVTGDIDCSRWQTTKLLTCNFSSAASLGDENHDAVAVLSAMVPVMAGFRTAATPVPVAAPGVQVLLMLLMAGSGLVALARR